MNSYAIPKDIRETLASDRFMKRCIHVYNSLSEPCDGRVEWEHAFGRKNQRTWNIVPCCTYHHRGKGLDKRYNEFFALMRARETQLRGFSRAMDMVFKKRHLMDVYLSRLIPGTLEYLRLAPDPGEDPRQQPLIGKYINA